MFIYGKYEPLTYKRIGLGGKERESEVLILQELPGTSPK